MRRAVALLVALAAILVLTGCPTEPAPRGTDGELVVFAAASLSDVFRTIGGAFEETRPGVRVRFNFAGSQQLASQILEGAPGDVFAPADPHQMERVSGGGLTTAEPTFFAQNEMTMVVEPGNPLGLEGLDDLAREELVVVLAGEEVPAGRYAARVLERAAVDARPDSREVDVRQALAKVIVGEADAAIVYASDAVAAGEQVATIPIPEAVNVRAHYPVAVLRRASAPAAARAFVDFLGSSEVRRILEQAGFTVP